jgi:tetratricopeptide (TPR) repeat protein
MHREPAAIALGLLALASSSTLLRPARADDTKMLDGPADSPAAVAEAREHFTRGLRLYREGRLEASLAELEKAVDLAPSYRLHYNIGRVQSELGNYVAAMHAFRRYLAQGGDRIPSDRRVQVRREVADLEGRVARVNVKTNVEGAVIAVDEIRAGFAPLSSAVWVNPGIRRISALKAGYLPSTVTVTAASGDQIDVALELPANPGPGRAVAPPAPRQPDLQAAVAPSPSRSHLKTWLSVLVTGALAAGASGFAVLTHQARQDLEQKLVTIPDTRVAVEDAGLRIVTFAAITGALAVGTLVAGGVAFHYGLSDTRTGSQPPPPPRPGLQLSFDAQPGRLLATGRF